MTKIYVFMVFFWSITLNAQKTFYVSPNGNDNSVGTKKQPLASLTGARNAIRKHKTAHQKNEAYTVVVKDGFYTMKETFVLTPEDSGTKDLPIVYKAEKGANPVFSGGKKIEGFTLGSQGVWQVKILESAYYGWTFNQLYVNGRRATLARTPNTDFFNLAKVTQDVWEQGSGKVALKAEQQLFFDEETFQPLLNIKEEEVSQVRFKAYHKWDYTLRHINKINKDNLFISTSGKGMKPWNPLKKGGRVIFENFKAALDAQGEWFLNKQGVLYYIPKEGQTIENTTIVAPVLEQLVTLKGNALEDEYVENIHVEGLTFEHCHYKIPRTGSEPNQAAAKLNAAIFAQGARNISFTNCEISKTGQHALWIGKGSSNAIVENTYMHNLGGGGVYIGDFKSLNGKEHTSHVTVNNNIIKSGGQEFPAAVGVWVGHSSDSKVTHNDIGNFYYTGISVGWTWGYKPSLAKRNTIAYNHIHHIGWDLLSDMAGIYMLGESQGTKVNNNVIHHVHAYSYGGWGMYADEGSTGITFENNLVYNTKTGGFQQNYGKENVVKNNILAFAKLYQMQCTVPEKHKSFTFTNNIIIFKEGMVAKGAFDEVNAIIDHNIYWNQRGVDYDFNKHTFNGWQQKGFDIHSYLIDPEFKNPLGSNFKFKSKKNYQKINFVPFDTSEVGVYGNKKWKQKTELSKEILLEFDKAVEKNIKSNPKRG